MALVPLGGLGRRLQCYSKGSPTLKSFCRASKCPDLEVLPVLKGGEEQISADFIHLRHSLTSPAF